jgi:hypothetical protein
VKYEDVSYSPRWQITATGNVFIKENSEFYSSYL